MKRCRCGRPCTANSRRSAHSRRSVPTVGPSPGVSTRTRCSKFRSGDMRLSPVGRGSFASRCTMISNPPSARGWAETCRAGQADRTDRARVVCTLRSREGTGFPSPSRKRTSASLSCVAAKTSVSSTIDSRSSCFSGGTFTSFENWNCGSSARAGDRPRQTRRCQKQIFHATSSLSAGSCVAKVSRYFR